MPWQKPLTSDANRSLAADDQAAASGQAANPALATEPCQECDERLVQVEFAEKPGTRTVFMGARYQYVNLSSEDLVGVDPAVSSAHQLGQTPPIVVRVVPPKSKTVTLRIVREERSHGFPGGSATLSAREQGLAHLTWPISSGSVTTDADGTGKLDPGLTIPALGGFKYRVEGSIDGKPFVRSSNSVNVRRRLALRQVVRHVNGAPAAASAITSIQGDLDQLDIEVFQPPQLSGAEFGVREIGELSPTLQALGEAALDSPNTVSVFRPHAVAVIVGEFVPTPNGPVTVRTFSLTVPRGVGGTFPASTPLPLRTGGSQFIMVPLTNGSQFVEGSVAAGTPPVEQPLTAADITGLDTFSRSVTVSLARFQAQPASVAALTITLKLKAVNGWAVGWAYTNEPVIYLNMRDPNTNAILAADKASALVIHELAHKLHLSSRGTGNAPDQQPHFYDSFTAPNGRAHQGPHCSTGVPSGADLSTDASHTAATCTMWGSLKGIRLFCPECKTTLRKVDLSTGF